MTKLRSWRSATTRIAWHISKRTQKVRHTWPLGHYYSPLPDNRELAREPAHSRVWPAVPKSMPGIDWREDEQLALIKHLLHEYPLQLPYEATSNPRDYHGANGLFPLNDAWTLQAMVRDLRPSRIIEVGSGWSSLLTARINREYFAGAIDFTCIEPHPPDVLKTAIDGISRLLASPVQEVSVETFEALGNGDILFIDTSHVVKTGGDVPYLYHEVLPRLRHGVVVHIHDIFLPYDYPEFWVQEGRGWNEQYLVQSFLAFNDSFRVQLGVSWLRRKHPELLSTAIGRTDQRGGSLWLRRVQ
jgi:predicted O-methyltransferase YrrM